jgi:hypothetical protein
MLALFQILAPFQSNLLTISTFWSSQNELNVLPCILLRAKGKKQGQAGKGLGRTSKGKGIRQV